jgi:hypothetical protein
MFSKNFVRSLYMFAIIYLLPTAHGWGQAIADTTTLRQEDSLRFQENRIPVFNMDSESEADFGSQDISGLLQSSRDIFTATAGFSFGQARFRIRGYGSENTTVFINGIRLNDMETGRAIWSSWGGLNDVTRFQDVQTGITSSREGFTALGGYSSIEARASSMRKGLRVSYAGTNRAYNHRLMATYATGKQQNGWSFAASGSRRYSGEGYVEGTWFDAWAYYLSAEKEINKKHTIGLTVFGAPTRQGRQGLAVQEAFDLAGTNYYNPDWGYQNGQKRNARVSNFHKPTSLLTHYFTIDDNTSLKTTLFVSGGRGGVTRLNWYEAADPRPTYYRYLPSFHDEGSVEFNALTESWQNDVNRRQINWDDFYHANRKNLYTVADVDGIPGNSVTGMRSKYMVEEMRFDHYQYGANSVFEKRFGPKTIFSAGYNLSIYKGNQYRQANDLLGGEFWLDVDQFAERDFADADLAQNDVDNPNRLIREGDRFGFDFTNNVNRHDLFAQMEHDFGKWDTYAAVNYSFTEFWRTGNMRNARFPENSFGDAEKQQFHNVGIKTGAVYKISGRQYLSANAAALTRAPQIRNAYISPRFRDDVVPNLQNEQILSGDVNYLLRYPKIKLRATLYYTEIRNQTWQRSFYHDEYRNFVNYTMTGVDNLFTGSELGIDWAATSTISVIGVLAHGQSIYSSRPLATMTRDNDRELLAENRTVYLKNFRLGGMPQTAAALGARYNSPKYWFVGFTANFFDHIYLDPNPDRRTAEALEQYVSTDPQWQEIIDQERLAANFTLDIYGGKSWRVKGKFINFNASISNVLNNQNFRIGGFEQLRYTSSDIGRFPPMYSYMFGFTFFAMVSVSF